MRKRRSPRSLLVAVVVLLAAVRVLAKRPAAQAKPGTALSVPVPVEVDRTQDDADTERRMPWRPVVGAVIVLAGAFCLFKGISALNESGTVPIPQEKLAADNYVKLDVPQPASGNALYFGRCTMTANYAHWDRPPFRR
ncbi:hypothetical protein LFM09_43005 [Lentzea alba]|uniref:hypothetical protein n=1 Tax=Lentzea alba TaxID=2714351 RepID=UPI0039BF8D7A